MLLRELFVTTFYVVNTRQEIKGKSMGSIKLLDCTLRDGGYINDWKFGHNNIVTIFERLISAEIDIVEVGFIDERREYDYERSILPDTYSVEKTYGDLERGKTMIVGMIDFGTCGIEHIQMREDSYLDGIRVIFKKEKMHEAIAFCEQIKEKGYDVYVQAVSITSYNDKEFNKLITLVNKLQPYAFSLVDTYGLLHKQQLEHYFVMADSLLKPDIALGYHAHNNFQLAYSNCIEVLEKNLERTLIIDGTLYGMGKSAGNAPTELLSMYMNEHNEKKYRVHQLLEAIDVTMLDIYHATPWGYNFKFFLSASNDCHPNYVAYLQEKRKLSVKSINEILSSISAEKKLLYDEMYIEMLYRQYQGIECDDFENSRDIQKLLKDRTILVLASGNNVYLQRDRITKYINENNPIIFSVNFLPEDFCVDYLFLTNAKRYVQMATQLSRKIDVPQIIATSNVTSASVGFDYILNYSRLLDEEALMRENPLFMLLKLFEECNIAQIALAGFDGYDMYKTTNYVNANMEYTFTKEKAEQINEDVRKCLLRSGLLSKIKFLTDSYYVEK